MAVHVYLSLKKMKPQLCFSSFICNPVFPQFSPGIHTRGFSPLKKQISVLEDSSSNLFQILNL